MSDIKRIADLMYQSVIQRNPDILKAGLIVLATDQKVMVKSSVYFIPRPITAGKDEVEGEVEEAAKEFDFHVYHLDKVKVILDEGLKIRAVIISGGSDNFPGFQQQHLGYGRFPQMGEIHPTDVFEVIGFSDAGMYPGNVFGLYDALCKIYDGKAVPGGRRADRPVPF
ncbi:hypothetical protein PQB86_gp117 [Klebsiella phage Miami]|uniref:Uncharacterized protein n=1 Tax=Klebsiella phage Miami TaxID=2767581 RepID=A0A873WJK7_9CAUD|nr:hypothetical protein PQB86_gp117 [Klebsiella phage Miami]QPB09212.1 hypothetical protein CPT_Miami_117 [Klebsiella phage Miami]